MTTTQRQPTLLVIDDFLPAPLGIRQAVLHGEFKTVKHGGVEYQGIQGCVFDFGQQLSEAMGREVKQRVCFFRLIVAGDKPTTYIHADSAESKWAAVIYLTKPNDCRGGTAFWRHKDFKIDRIEQCDTATADQLNRDGTDQASWEMVGLAGMAFNRAVIYPSCLFHSRYPEKTWGYDKESGRLIFASFFDLV